MTPLPTPDREPTSPEGDERPGRSRISSREALRFLTELSAALARSLDSERTLQAVARLAVPRLACYCLVDVLEDGALQRVAATHRDPAQGGLLDALAPYSPEVGSGGPADAVLGSGRPWLLERVTEEWLAGIARDERHRDLLLALAPTSLMLVPLVARRRTLGSLLLASTRTDRHYGERDLALAEEVGQLAGLALENARLYEEARRAVRARDEVLAIVSHDLRNPIGRILTTVQLLMDPAAPPDPATLERFLPVIDRAAHSMHRLVGDLLDVTRIEAGKLAMEPLPVRARALLAEAAEALAPDAAAAALELAVETEGSLPSVRADRERVLQVFANLVGNAVKFTPPGGRITLGAVDEGERVRFRVADTGPGIAPERLPHLFDRFWQGDPRDRRGAGLGLAIARGIVEAHGGEVGVESEVGRGSTFWFTLSTAAG